MSFWKMSIRKLDSVQGHRKQIQRNDYRLAMGFKAGKKGHQDVLKVMRKKKWESQIPCRYPWIQKFIKV